MILPLGLPRDQITTSPFMTRGIRLRPRAPISWNEYPLMGGGLWFLVMVHPGTPPRSTL